MPPTWVVYIGAIAAVASAVFLAINVYLNWRRPKDEGLRDEGKWKGSVEKAIENFEGFMDTTSQNLTLIYRVLVELSGRLPERSSESGSPIQLTDFGERLAVDMTAYQWADKTSEDVFSNVITEMRPYQVEDFCRDHVKNHLSEKWREKVAESAYEAGTSKENVEQVLVIVLRDELLKRRGGQL